MRESQYKFLSIVKEYAYRLFGYDIALWVLMLFNYAMLGVVTIAVLEMKGQDPETIVELGQAWEKVIWLMIGILFGRPVLNMAGRAIYDRVIGS